MGKVLHWHALAISALLISVGFLVHDSEAAHLRVALGKAEEKLATALAVQPPKRLELKSMEPVMRSFDASGKGRAYFTNVSPRAGVVCVVGVVTNLASDQTAESIPNCAPVVPYAAITIEVQFGRTAFDEVCDKNGCRMSVEEAPYPTQ